MKIGEFQVSFVIYCKMYSIECLSICSARVLFSVVETLMQHVNQGLVSFGYLEKSAKTQANLIFEVHVLR